MNRVLHVVTTMNMGGIENMIMNLYRVIDRSLIQFDFLMHRQKESYFDKEILSLGGKIFRVPSINPFHHHKYLESLNDFFLQHNEFKIVHSHINAFSLYPLRAAQLAGVPIRIAHAHTSKSGPILKAPFRIYAKNNLQRYCTHCFACGKEAGAWLFGKDVLNTSNYYQWPNTIDLSKYSYNAEERKRIRDQLHIENEVVFCHVGSLCKIKNQSFLLDILSNTYRHSPNTILLLIGDGSAREKLKIKARKLGILRKVIFLGVRSDVASLLQAADCLIFPSIHEGFPVALIEAQAAGLQCFVSSNIDSDIDVTGNVIFLDLKFGPEYWADYILCNQEYRHVDTFMQMRDAGYDSRDAADRLAKLYKSFSTF